MPVLIDHPIFAFDDLDLVFAIILWRKILRMPMDGHE